MKKARKEWNVSNSPKGSGDYYGVGIKNPVGKVIRNYMDSNTSSRKLGKAPKSLA